MRTALFTMLNDYDCPMGYLEPWLDNNGKRVVVVEEPREDESSNGIASHRVVFPDSPLGRYYVDADELTDFLDEPEFVPNSYYTGAY